MRIINRNSLAAVLTLLPCVAFAHPQVGVAGGLASGFLHPLTGADHLVAMLAVGIWAAQLGTPALWVLPVTFPAFMAIGGALGVMQVPLPAAEVGIALSALVLGCVVALRQRAPFWAAAMVVAAFAVCHGHAHGTELPAAADPVAYGAGFVAATALLHLCGIGIGTLLRWPAGARVVQGLGAGIAALGVFFLVGTLSGG